MANLAAHIIKKFYDSYHNREIAFNKSIINVTGLETNKVFLKIKGEQWSCVLYSCSMKSAKIIAKMDSDSFDFLKKAKNFVNLRLSFLPEENKNSIVFFIPGIVEGYKNFSTSNNTSFLINISFTQRPPDDLIEILGKIILEKENFEKRKDIRINLEGKIILDIGLRSNKGILIIDNIKRACILKNISISGAFVFLSCLPKFIMNKNASLIISTIKSKNPIFIEGAILRNEQVAGRTDIYGIGISFIREKIPLEFIQMLNSYIDKLEDIASKNK